MSVELENFIKRLLMLREKLDNSHKESMKASFEAANFGSEWDQEISEDLLSLSVNMENLVNDLDEIISEAKSIYNDWINEENLLIREGGETETVVDESAQEDIKEHLWREERSKRDKFQ
jgi:hypothetical protein